MHDVKKRTLLPCLLLTCALLLSGCSQRPGGTETLSKESAETAAAVPTAEPTPEATPVPTFTVTFTLSGEVLCSAQVEEGTTPTLPETDASGIIGWLDENGQEVYPETVPIESDRCFVARLSTDLLKTVYYLRAEGGLFRPTDALTRQECALMLYELLPEKPPVPETLPSEPADIVLGLNAAKASEEETPEAAAVISSTALSEMESTLVHDLDPDSETEEQTEEAPVESGPTDYEIFAAVVAAGYMDAREDGSLYPGDAVSAGEFRTILSAFFSNAALDSAFGALGEGDVTRLDAASVMNSLLERSVPDENRQGTYPDVDDDFFLIDTIRAAAPGCEEAPEAGMLLLSNGQLYYITEEGRCLKDDDVGTMHFGPDGRFTSGSDELDRLVSTAIAKHVNVEDDHITQLRSVYDYVRDNFAYLRRNYYKQGQHGWEVEEATFLLDTHKGNCYSFAAGLWALCRGIGYDAGAISGEIGENYTSHGWVYITLEDGVCYFFDVEIEYAALRDGATNYPMFKLPWSGATVNWTYTYDWNVEGFPKY